MNEDYKRIGYVAFRGLEVLSICIFIFGFMWNSTEMLKLSVQEFMMLYGGFGAVVCEILSRIFSSKKKEQIKETAVEEKKDGLP